jgi:hypothetical protein
MEGASEKTVAAVCRIKQFTNVRKERFLWHEVTRIMKSNDEAGIQKDHRLRS